VLLSKQEQYNSAFVALCYFNYLKRDPDPQGHEYWLQALKSNSNDLSAVINGFISSGEYRSRFWSALKSEVKLGHSQNHLAVAGGYVVDALVYKKAAHPPATARWF